MAVYKLFDRLSAIAEQVDTITGLIKKLEEEAEKDKELPKLPEGLYDARQAAEDLAAEIDTCIGIAEGD